MEHKPTNILGAIFYGVEVTNQNIVALSENVKDLFDKVQDIQAQVDAVRAFFDQPTPEKPMVSGEEGVATESKRPIKQE